MHAEEIKQAGEVPGFDQMHDIVVPDPVSWWPLAPGWWVVLLLLVFLLAWGLAVFYFRWKSREHRREALKELESIDASQYSALLKRVCLVEFDRELVAGLSGEQWLEFLDEVGEAKGKKAKAFTEGAGREILELAYKGGEASDACKAIVKDWLE